MHSNNLKLRRQPKRVVTDQTDIYRILDDALICHIAFTEDGRSMALPTAFARIGDTICVHGAANGRLLTRAIEQEVCITVAINDGLVLARAALRHSLNYRSIVILQQGRELKNEHEKSNALRALIEKIDPGRWAQIRQPTQSELRATRVVTFELNNLSAKTRSGPPLDVGEDINWPVWAGVIPIVEQRQPPIAEPNLDPALKPPMHGCRQTDEVHVEL